MDKIQVYSKIKEKLNKIPNNKRTQYLIIIVMIAVILAIYFSTFTTDDTAKPDATVSSAIEKSESAELDLNGQLENILSSIEGAGAVRVMITYESGTEIVPATSENTETTTTNDESDGSTKTSETVRKQTDIVTVQDQSESSALVLKEKMPEVKGVIVIAKGAGDIGVKMNLLKAVQTLLNISADKVDVFEMQS
jgi:stage III sporulation protein AG